MLREPDELSYLELAALPSAPYWARRQTRASLEAWQLYPETIETAELLVSEIVTNAIKASSPSLERLPDDLDGADRVTLTLRLLPGRLVIEVYDNDTNPPLLAAADGDAESGRGLTLVEALSKEWGHNLHPSGGKTVFCVIITPDQPRPSQASGSFYWRVPRRHPAPRDRGCVAPSRCIYCWP